MADELSYLGLLNAIAVGEARGQALLEAWSARTTDAGLADLLRLVAIREQEHAAAFTKRLCELGFAVRSAPLGDFESKLEAVKSARSDREKFECLFGYDEPAPDPDPLANLFDDRTIDPQTGALLGRFIAEVRDSERRLRACYANLGKPVIGDDALAEISTRLERLTATLEELKSIRRR